MKMKEKEDLQEMKGMVEMIDLEEEIWEETKKEVATERENQLLTETLEDIEIDQIMIDTETEIPEITEQMKRMTTEAEKIAWKEVNVEIMEAIEILIEKGILGTEKENMVGLRGVMEITTKGT